MKKYTFKNPVFVKTAVSEKDYPHLKSPQGQPLVELAICGRSNVGKSSLLNHLFQCKNLVKVSRNPGKTQGLNFFKINGEFCFVDLPGYGYAKVSKKMLDSWAVSVDTYLNHRPQLILVLLLLDIRHLPSQEDLTFLQWAKESKKPLIIILTKVDKLTKQQREENQKKISKIIGKQHGEFILYSVKKNIGRQALINKIQESLFQLTSKDRP